MGQKLSSNGLIKNDKINTMKYNGRIFVREVYHDILRLIFS
jgi:hypothetical protein